jgi:hypothetical protein
MFWSGNVQKPSFLINGLVIDHPDGVSLEPRKPESANDEIAKLASKEL